MTLQDIVSAYLAQFQDEVPPLGGDAGGSGSGFREQLAASSARSRKFFWVCVAVLVALFAVTLTTAFIYFEVLTSSRASTMQAAFGATAGTAVLGMIKFGRDHSRAEFLIAALAELRDIDEKRFAKLVSNLAEKWYRVGAKKSA